MKSGCKPKKTLRMAVGGAFSSPLQDAYDKQAKDFARVPTTTTPVGGDFGPGRNPRDPNNRPVATPGGNELIHTMGPESMARPAVEPMRPGGNELIHTMGPESMARPAVEPMRYETTGGPATTVRPAVGLDHTMASTPQQSLRSAVAPTLTPSALEQRLNDRMNAGTLTIRGAGMLQGIEDSRRQADVQRYGIDTSADTAKLGYKNQMDIAGMNNQTNIRGQDLNYNLGQQGLKNQWDLGVLGSNTTIRGQDLNYNLGVMGNNTTIRGQDLNYNLGVMGNNTQNSIADKNRQTALDNMQNQWDMNQYNQDANTFNMLANNRSRSFGLRNGGEIHAANGFMPGGFASRAADIKWLSPYWGLQATAAMADQDTKQDYMRAQTEALRAQTERAGRGPTQDQVNAARLAEDQARRRFSHEEEDRAMRNKMAQAAFDTKMRNDLQDRAMALADRERALNTALKPKFRDPVEDQRYNDAQRASITAGNRDQDAMASAWLAKQQAARDQSQALSDRQWREDGLRARADQATYLANEQAKTDRTLAANRYQANNAARQLATIRANALQDQDRQTEQARYAQAQAMARAAQQPGMTGRPEDWNGSGYRTHGGTAVIADPYAAEEQRRYDAAQRLEAERYGQAQREHQVQQSHQFQRDFEAAERAKREDAYIAQSRADARSRQLEGDFYAREDRARNYALLQDANARLNADRRGPMSLDPRFTHANGVPRFGLRHGGSPAIDNGLGGAVPGTGKGDKIPAMYEPNEFVVSNDMLDAEPELRDHLRDLRERVLAAKGMTVAEADAKAVGRGRGLRAAGGFGYVDAEMNDAAALDPMVEVMRRKAEADAAARALLRTAVDTPAEARPDSYADYEDSPRAATRVQPVAVAPRYSQADVRRVDNAIDTKNAAEAAQRASDLRSYADAQSAALDAGKSAPALPKSLRDTGNIYKTVDAQGRVTYSGGNVKAGAKFIGGDGEEFTPRGSVEYAKPGTRFAATPDGKGAVFTPVSEDKNQRAADIAQNAVDIAKWKAKEAAEAPLRAKEQERQDMIGEVRSMEQAAMSGDNRAAALLPGARNLLADRLKTDALERSEAEKNAAHIKGIKLQTQGTLDAARAKKLAERENEMIIAEALKKTEGNSEATVDLLAKAGRGDLSKILSERVTADNDRRTKDYENMLKEFKGMVRTPDGAEIPGGAELAANELAAIVKAKNEERAKAGKPPISNILDADDRAGMMKEATLRARAISGMRAKQSLRDASMIPWAGLKGAPSGLVPSASPERIGFWNGAATGGGVSRGDYEYGDYYLPQDVGQDVIDYLGDVASKKAKGAR